MCVSVCVCVCVHMCVCAHVCMFVFERLLACARMSVFVYLSLHKNLFTSICLIRFSVLDVCFQMVPGKI